MKQKAPIPSATGAVNSPSHQLLSGLAACRATDQHFQTLCALRWHPRASRVPEPLSSSSSPRPKTCCPLPPASHAFALFLSLSSFSGFVCSKAAKEAGQALVGKAPNPPFESQHHHLLHCLEKTTVTRSLEPFLPAGLLEPVRAVAHWTAVHAHSGPHRDSCFSDTV